MEPKINQSELLSFGQADINLHLLRIMDKVDSPTSHSSSRIGKSRRAMVAKIKAYYKHQSQLSETTVILSTRAVVRRETATNDAFAEKYNEATCQKYRESTQEWAEMWVALTKRGIMFYLASKKHPTLAILFPPYTAIAPRISLFSTLDLSLAIMYHDRSASIQTSAKGKSEDSEAKDSLQVAIIKFPSAQVACQWYREIGQALLLGRVMFPSAFLNESMPAAQPPPSLVMVNVPELGIKVQVKLGRHNAQVPRNVLMGGSDDALLERQWRCETTTVWHIRQDVVNVLLKDSVVGKSICEWLEAERRGELTIGMAWRRCDRLEWIMPCGALDTNGNFKVDTVNDMVVGPQLLEGTHMLELRVLEHYPDIITTNSTCIYEPVGVEGFVMLKREQKHRVVSYKPALLTTHNGYLFFVDAPRAVRYLDASIHKCNSQPAVGEGVCDSDDGSQVVCYYHPDERSCSKQMSLAKYMLNITDIEQIVPLVHDYDDTPDSNGMATFLDGGLGLESVSENAEPTSQSTHRPKGKLLGFLRSKKARQSACKFRLVTRTGSSVVIWTPNEQCMREWVRRLTELRYYWTNRMIADYSLYSQTCLLNYSTQGHSSRIRDDMDWFDEGAWAERLVWNACLILGCRSIIKAGILYRKRHRHQGMRKVFCILTRGRLIEFKYPVAPLAPGQTMLAEYMIRNDPTMSHVFKDICDNNKSLGEAVSSADKSSPSLLFARSRSLSLRRCYVVSRFADDLSTHDIMCEPWVMTDIGNYNGLRLADRVYADGIVSHELINDCIFTVWRPTFVPPILRTSKAPHSLEDLSDQSADGQATQGSGADSRCSSPTPAGPDSNRSRAVSFSPPLVAVVPPAATESAVHQRSFSHDYGRQSIESQIEPAKASLDMPRLSGDGYNSSVSNASSVSSSRHDTSKPGAYRVGDEIHLNVDDKRNGKRRMSAIGMASSMRRRIGVYRARTNSEMAQWHQPNSTVADEILHRGSFWLYPDNETAWPEDKELALMILNEPIPHSESPLFARLWARAQYRICIDGGGNRLYDFGKAEGTLEQFIPDAVVGDLDSLQAEPRSYYETRGAVIHRYSDQNSTDFMKGLKYIDSVMRVDHDVKSCLVVVFGGLGGRLDHILHTLKVLFNNHKQREIVIISDDNLTFVVPKGRNRILIDKQVDGPTCGILPLAGETILTTSGLRWNLDHHPSSFEGLMSTSNIIDEPSVIIETTLPVAWTAQFHPRSC
ncbi:thiamine pyrophosphokinase [Coemansia sp. RSA 989]|nr:thiamine pyrophosphokinase [Coemansia sp. RSA 989]